MNIIFGFRCNACGGSALTPPDELSAESTFCCVKCRSQVGTWSDLQAIARLLAARSGSLRFQLGTDPLPATNLEDEIRRHV